jgi:hypothetical protein
MCSNGPSREGPASLAAHLVTAGPTTAANWANACLFSLQGRLDLHGVDIPMQFSQSREQKSIDVSKLQTDWTCPKVSYSKFILTIIIFIVLFAWMKKSHNYELSRETFIFTFATLFLFLGSIGKYSRIRIRDKQSGSACTGPNDLVFN